MNARCCHGGTVGATRGYSSPLREQQAAATRARIEAAAQELFTDPTSDFTVERVASMADVSVQTVLRAFGNRNGLIRAAIGTLRASDAPGAIEHVPIGAFASAAAGVTALFDDYERIGDRVVRLLAEEHRVDGFAEMAAIGRDIHRQWVEDGFQDALAATSSRRRTEVTTALVAATDVYVWKVLRRDLGLERRAAERIVVRLVRGALSESKES